MKDRFGFSEKRNDILKLGTSRKKENHIGLTAAESRRVVTWDLGWDKGGGVGQRV